MMPSRGRSGWLIAVITCLAVGTPLALVAQTVTTGHPARPTNKKARRYLARCETLYKDGEAAAAIAACKKGHAVEPWPWFLFLIANAERFRGDCETAIQYYQQYLDTEPPANDATLARSFLGECHGDPEYGLDAPPPDAASLSGPPPDAAPPDAAPPDAEVTTIDPPAAVPDAGAPPNMPEPRRADPDPARPWYRDPWGGAFVGAGAVALGFGVAFYLTSNDELDTAHAATSYPDFERAVDDARGDRRASQVGFGVGAGLLIVGVARWLWIDLADQPGTADFKVGWAPGIGGPVVERSF